MSIGINKQKKLDKIKKLENRLKKIYFKNDGTISYRIRNNFERKINKIKESLKINN